MDREEQEERRRPARACRDASAVAPNACERYSALGCSVAQQAARKPGRNAGDPPGSTAYKVYTRVRRGEATATPRKVAEQLGRLLPCQVEEAL